MIRFITSYIEKTETYSTKRFILEMFMITLFSKFLLFLIITLFVDFLNFEEDLFFGGLETRADSLIGDLHWVSGFVLLCIFVPFFESLIGQVIPISLITLFSKSKIIQIFFSVFVNTLFHYPFAFYGFIITFILSFVLAWGYVLYRKQGVWNAIIIITIIHGLYNFIPFLMVYLFPN